MRNPSNQLTFCYAALLEDSDNGADKIFDLSVLQSGLAFLHAAHKQFFCDWFVTSYLFLEYKSIFIDYVMDVNQ